MKTKFKLDLYNSMIISLILGIIIVITTLFLARPEPESFTELYINDFQNLPKFLSQNQNTNFSVTIHNLENNNFTYNYSLRKELYKVNYCNEPTLYMTDNKTKTYHLDPGQIIKEDYYELEFSYSPKTKDPVIRILFSDIYEIEIDERQNKTRIIKLNPLPKNPEITETEYEFMDFTNKNIMIIYDNPTLQLYINNELISETSIANATKGYFDFAQENGLSTFYNVKTRQNNKITDYRIINSDVEYERKTIREDENKYSFDFDADDFLLETSIPISINGTAEIRINDIIIPFENNGNLKVFRKNNTLELYKNNQLKAEFFTDAQESVNVTIKEKNTRMRTVSVYTDNLHKSFYLGTEQPQSFDELIEEFSIINIPEEELRRIYLEILEDIERDITFSLNYLLEGENPEISIQLLDPFNITIRKGSLKINNNTYPITQNRDWNNFHLESRENTIIYHNGDIIANLNTTFDYTPMVEYNSTGAITKNVYIRDGEYYERFDEETCNPEPYKVISENSTITIPHDYNETINYTVSIEDEYDYAKIAFSLDNLDQEVYFWVMDI
ncbi:MAG: hypothetical protein ACLFUO_04940 [Candidatus Woesearchaeota archaeon]